MEKRNNYLRNIFDKFTQIKNLSKSSQGIGSTEYLEILINEASEKYNLGDELTRTLSKDLSRWGDNISGFSNTLESINTMNGKDRNIDTLLSKISTEEFFKEYWGDDSNGFYRTKKFVEGKIPDKRLAHKIISTIDSMVTGVFRNINGRYKHNVQ